MGEAIPAVLTFTFKACCRCKETKPLDAFYNTGRTRSRKQVWCIQCFKSYYRDLKSDRRARGLCGSHGKPVMSGTTRCAQCRSAQRANHIAKRYGITTEEYDAILAAQGGGCALCGRKDNAQSIRRGLRRSLAVDHDHATGRVRGILCGNCNTAIGKACDSPGRLRAMAEYLEPTPEWIGAGC